MRKDSYSDVLFSAADWLPATSRKASCRDLYFSSLKAAQAEKRRAELDAQRMKLRAYCRAMDLQLVTVHADKGLSTKSLKRPGLQSALAMIQSGEADARVVGKLARLTRSVRLQTRARSN